MNLKIKIRVTSFSLAIILAFSSCNPKNFISEFKQVNYESDTLLSTEYFSLITSNNLNCLFLTNNVPYNLDISISNKKLSFNGGIYHVDQIKQNYFPILDINSKLTYELRNDSITIFINNQHFYYTSIGSLVWRRDSIDILEESFALTIDANDYLTISSYNSPEHLYKIIEVDYPYLFLKGTWISIVFLNNNQFQEIEVLKKNGKMGSPIKLKGHLKESILKESIGKVLVFFIEDIEK